MVVHTEKQQQKIEAAKQWRKKMGLRDPEEVADEDSNVIEYIYNEEHKSIIRSNFDKLRRADAWFNEIRSGNFADNFEKTWNVPTGAHYGIIAEMYYKNAGTFDEAVILKIITDKGEIFCSKLRSRGMFSPWRMACARCLSGDQADIYTYSFEGVIVKFEVSTKTYDSGKVFTKITQLDFMSDDEYNIILQSGGYQKGGYENAQGNGSE